MSSNSVLKFRVTSESYLAILDALYQADTLDPVFSGIEFVVPIYSWQRFESEMFFVLVC